MPIFDTNHSKSFLNRMDRFRNLKNLLNLTSSTPLAAAATASATTTTPTTNASLSGSHSRQSSSEFHFSDSNSEKSSPTSIASKCNENINGGVDVNASSQNSFQIESANQNNSPLPLSNIKPLSSIKPGIGAVGGGGGGNGTISDASRRLSGFLQFRSKSTKQQKKSDKKKFFRSTSLSSVSNSRRTSQQVADNVAIDANEVDTENNMTTVDFNLSKKELLYHDIEPNMLFDWLSKELNDLIKHFKPSNYSESSRDEIKSAGEQSLTDADLLDGSRPLSACLETNEVTGLTFFELSQNALRVFNRCIELCNLLNKNIHVYDYDCETIKWNGYRSLLKVFENACRRLLFVVHDLNEKKTNFLFQMRLMNNMSIPVNFNLKEFQTYVKLIEKIEILLKMGVEMQNQTLGKTSKDYLDSNKIFKFHEEPTLFVHRSEIADSTIEKYLFYLSSTHQEAFFGRACGFQFCESLEIPMTACVVAFASYNEGYEAYPTNKQTQSPTTPTHTPKATPVTTTTTTTTTSNFEYSEKSNTHSKEKSNTNYKIDETYTLKSAQTQGSAIIDQNAAATAAAPNTTAIATLPAPSSSSSFSNTLNAYGQAFKSLLTSTKYIMDPELRAKKVSNLHYFILIISELFFPFIKEFNKLLLIRCLTQ
jgi:hypothetical protein